MLGAIFSKIDIRDYKLKCGTKIFPDSYEIEYFKKDSKVKNQGSVGSCVAHALSTVIEYYTSIQNNINIEMSTGYIYGNRLCTIMKNEGLVVREALSTIKLYGDVQESKFPYNKEVPDIITKFEEHFEELYEDGYTNRISSYCKLNSIEEMKSILMEGKPIVFAIKWYSDMRVKNGILTSTCKKKNYLGGHCMVIYGWNDEGWLVQNSHGRFWGSGGKCILPYDMKIREAWGVIDTIVGTSIVLEKPFSHTLLKFIALSLNKLFNLIIRK